jgi:hypothetical protein
LVGSNQYTSYELSVFCHGCVEWFPVVGGGSPGLKCTSYMMTHTWTVVDEAYVWLRGPQSPVPGGAQGSQVVMSEG